MPTGEFSVETKASVSDAHAYLADLRNEAEWRDDVIGCDIESGTPGQDGAVYRQHVHQGPGTAWHRIQAHVGSPSDVSFVMLGNYVIRANGTCRVTESSDGGSVVHYSLRITLRGPATVIRPVVARELSRRVSVYPSALKPRLDALRAG